MTQSCFPNDFPSTGSNRSYIDFEGGGRQPLLQHLLQEGQHHSDRALTGVFSVRRAPFDKQLPLQGISMSLRQRSRRSDGVDYPWDRSPRTSASHPGTRHEVSRGLDMGATRFPISESVDPTYPQ